MAEIRPLVLADGRVKVLPPGDTLPLPGSFNPVQKYQVAVSETYTIPQGISSVVTGPLEMEGILVLEGRLEVI